jgi:hypothetical protein
MVHVMLSRAEETYYIHKNSKCSRTRGAHKIIYAVPLDASNSEFDKSKENLYIAFFSFNSKHERKNYIVLLLTLKHIL